GHGRRQELAEDPARAHAPRDQLGVPAGEGGHEHLLGARFARCVARRLWTGGRLADRRHATGAPTGPPPLSGTPTGSGAAAAACVAPMPIPCSRWSCLPSL